MSLPNEREIALLLAAYGNRELTTAETERVRVLAAREGDEHAWSQLVDRFAPLVWSIARSFRLDHSSADDVFQEVWTQLSRNVGSIREPSRIAGWLSTTARNEALRVARRRERERPDSGLVDVIVDARQLPHDRPIQEASVRAEEARALVVALDSLDDRSQRLLRLLLIEPKLPYEEIAELMDMPIGSIGPTRARCLAKLRTALEQIGYR